MKKNGPGLSPHQLSQLFVAEYNKDYRNIPKEPKDRDRESLSAAHRKYVKAEALVGEARRQCLDAELALKDAERWRDEAHFEYWKARKSQP